MAIHEEDREDLLRDGRQMPMRGQCLIDGQIVLCGFRASNQLSMYCGPDPVFQFNERRELRRVFLDGRKFAADHHQLKELKRDERGGRVALGRVDVDPATSTNIMLTLRHWIEQIQNALESSPDAWQSAGVETGENELDSGVCNLQETILFRARLTDWIVALPADLPIALSPNA